MQPNDQEKLCLRETDYSVTSISTVDFVPQPVDEKSHYIRNRIFVGNFPNSATHKDISNVFRGFGEIIETNIVDSPAGNTRYGFVTFRNIASADAVLSLYFRGREFFVKGLAVNINRALFKPKRQNGKLPQPPSKKSPVMVMGGSGHAAVAEYVNGMAYFKPLKDVKAPSSVGPEAINPVPMKGFSGYQPIPVFALTNHFQFHAPIAISMHPNIPMDPRAFPIRPNCQLPFPPGFSSAFQAFNYPPEACFKRLLYGSMPAIR